jgi:hypothetical protein
VNTTYSDCALTLEKLALDRKRVLTIPTIYIEGRYEEERSTPNCIRAQLWWTYLSGSIGHVFGNKRIWGFEDDWVEALNTPGSRAVTTASRLLEWLVASGRRLTPAALDSIELGANRLGTTWARLFEPNYPRAQVWDTLRFPSAGIAVATAGRSEIVYLPHSVSLDYSGDASVTCWLSPRSGDVSVVAGALVAPEPGDWLLVFEERADICSRSSF